MVLHPGSAGICASAAGEPLVQSPPAASANPARQACRGGARFAAKKVIVGITILIALVFSKFFYLASITSYYTFYLMARFHIGVRSAQLHLFAFLAAVAAGTMIGGPIGDRVGRKAVIWWSILESYRSPWRCLTRISSGPAC